MRKFAEFISSKNVIESSKVTDVIVFDRRRKPIHPSEDCSPNKFDKAAWEEKVIMHFEMFGAEHITSLMIVPKNTSMPKIQPS